ncbi:FG-GAP repeat protein [Planctomycetes bacterium MalM25]|nr:FG-GAP repeat protein [Planctomycetes bacterium MalM25]
MDRAWAGMALAVCLMLPGCQRSTNAAPDAKPATTKATEPSGPAVSEGSSTKPPAPQVETQVETARVPTSGQTRETVEKLAELLDPNSTGWQTEAFNEAAGKRLKKLAASMLKPDGAARSDLKKLIAEGFVCGAFNPQEDAESVKLAGIGVRRTGAAIGTPLEGLDGLLKAIQTLPTPTADFHVKFKIVGVQPGDGIVVTPAYVEGGGVSRQGRVQWKADWRCTWTTGKDATPLLSSIEVKNYEQVITPERSAPWFVDETAAVLGDEPSYREQMLQSMDYWAGRIEGRLGINRLGHHGLAVGDVNNDGREDLYVCQAGGLPNRLYVTQPDGTARDIAASAGVDYLDDSTCALLVDLDNDGDQDLVVVSVSAAVVLSNDGRAKFTAQAIIPECRNAFSLTSADYDGDRLPDLYVGRYWPSDKTRGEIAIPVPYYDAENGGRNMLLRNTGEWRFEDTTDAAGLDESNTRFTMAAAWDDIDQDGDSDLYVANDFGRNCLYRNDGGRFVNTAVEAGVEDIASGMSVSFSDFDHNGHDDIYISNMFSSAGNRITYQGRYSERFGANSLAKIQRMARGNTLFKNRGDGAFEDVSVSADVTMGRWAWGSLFADFNNDSWDDLVVMNGFITTEDSGDL